VVRDRSHTMSVLELDAAVVAAGRGGGSAPTTLGIGGTGGVGGVAEPLGMARISPPIGRGRWSRTGRVQGGS
jgi:hypothetical protein